MSEIINGYTLLGPLTNANAGYGRWGFAKKGGVEYFIKEFLNPIYPTKESPYPPDMQEKIRAGCLEYQKSKQRLYRAVNETSDGNLVRIEEFFRWGSKYYIATRRAKSTMDPSMVAQQPMEDRLRVCCVLCHALMQMHEVGIVHADVKADNIIIGKSASGGVTAKLIDVDCSFFEDTPPEDGDDLGGDQNYFSPEGFLFKYLGPDEVDLSCKMDVYAMGILMHQLLTGSLPDFGGDYNYAFEASLDDRPIRVSTALPDSIRGTIAQMLRKEPAERLTMKQVFYRMRHALSPNVIWETAASTPVVSRPAAAPRGGRVKFGGFDRAIEMVREISAPVQHSAPPPSGKTSDVPSGEFFSKGGDL